MLLKITRWFHCSTNINSIFSQLKSLRLQEMNCTVWGCISYLFSVSFNLLSFFFKKYCCFPYVLNSYLIPLQVLFRESNGNPLRYSCLENPMGRGAWWAAVHEVVKSQTWLSDFTFTFHFHALEKAMATHSSVLAWRIPGTVEPGGLPSMGSHRVGHDWSDLAATAGTLGLTCLILATWHDASTIWWYPTSGHWPSA